MTCGGFKNFNNFFNVDIGAYALGFYGDKDVTNPQATTLVGASTLLCMDMEKDNIRTFSITKSYTCNDALPSHGVKPT
jgi:hypothetical protein